MTDAEILAQFTEPAWVQTSEWTYILRSGDVDLGRVARNGFNVLASGAGGEHLGCWGSVEVAQGAVERWLRTRGQQ